MICVDKKEDCCGCNACRDACPHHAISFVPDEEGFLYPKIDAAKCVQCGLCESACPILHVGKNRRVHSGCEATYSAAVSRNLETRFDSTSGGLFSEFANKIFDQGGFVGGAVWTDSFGIVQIVTDKSEDLPRLRSSKYAQSDASGFYLAVKEAVNTGKSVLVCGTPCQMAALRAYLGKDYDNLIIVDFVCRGINSPLVMRRYIEMFARLHGSKVVAVKQKSKELGWHRLTTKFTFSDGSVEYDPRETSLFMRGYLQGNVFCRPSCYDCKFKGLPRLTDLTIADCWSAVDSLHGNLNLDLGTSLVMCNTPKGMRFFDSVRDNVDCAAITQSAVVRGNRHLIEPLPRPTVNRREVFKKLTTGTFEDAMSFLGPVHKPDSRSAWRKAASFAKRRLLMFVRLFSIWLKSPLTVRINGWRAVVTGRPLLTPIGSVVVDLAPSASLRLEADTRIGETTFNVPTRLESRLQLRKGAVLRSRGYSFGYGCDIEIFEDGLLEVGPEGYSNIGLTIICGEHIKFGRGVICGRNVSIRDTNGEHYLNRDGYQVSKPVEIGDHVWLCEGCHIMPGVTIGAGSVVAAGAVVTRDVPSNVLVAGMPAHIVRENVAWR